MEDDDITSLASRLRRRTTTGSARTRPISYPSCISFDLRPPAFLRGKLMDRKPQKFIEPIPKDIALREGRKVKFADEAGLQLASYIEIPNKFERFAFRSLTNINTALNSVVDDFHNDFAGNDEIFDQVFEDIEEKLSFFKDPVLSPGVKRKCGRNKASLFLDKPILKKETPSLDRSHLRVTENSCPQVKLRKFSLDDWVINETEEEISDKQSYSTLKYKHTSESLKLSDKTDCDNTEYSFAGSSRLNQNTKPDRTIINVEHFQTERSSSIPSKEEHRSKFTLPRGISSEITEEARSESDVLSDKKTSIEQEHQTGDRVAYTLPSADDNTTQDVSFTVLVPHKQGESVGNADTKEVEMTLSYEGETESETKRDNVMVSSFEENPTISFTISTPCELAEINNYETKVKLSELSNENIIGKDGVIPARGSEIKDIKFNSQSEDKDANTMSIGDNTCANTNSSYSYDNNEVRNNGAVIDKFITERRLSCEDLLEDATDENDTENDDREEDFYEKQLDVIEEDLSASEQVLEETEVPIGQQFLTTKRQDSLESQNPRSESGYISYSHQDSRETLKYLSDIEDDDSLTEAFVEKSDSTSEESLQSNEEDFGANPHNSLTASGGNVPGRPHHIPTKSNQLSRDLPGSKLLPEKADDSSNISEEVSDDTLMKKQPSSDLAAASYSSNQTAIKSNEKRISSPGSCNSSLSNDETCISVAYPQQLDSQIPANNNTNIHLKDKPNHNMTVPESCLLEQQCTVGRHCRGKHTVAEKVLSGDVLLMSSNGEEHKQTGCCTQLDLSPSICTDNSARNKDPLFDKDSNIVLRVSPESYDSSHIFVKEPYIDEKPNANVVSKAPYIHAKVKVTPTRHVEINCKDLTTQGICYSSPETQNEGQRIAKRRQSKRGAFSQAPESSSDESDCADAGLTRHKAKKLKKSTRSGLKIKTRQSGSSSNDSQSEDVCFGYESDVSSEDGSAMATLHEVIIAKNNSVLDDGIVDDIIEKSVDSLQSRPECLTASQQSNVNDFQMNVIRKSNDGKHGIFHHSPNSTPSKSNDKDIKGTDSTGSTNGISIELSTGDEAAKQCGDGMSILEDDTESKESCEDSESSSSSSGKSDGQRFLARIPIHSGDDEHIGQNLEGKGDACKSSIKHKDIDKMGPDKVKSSVNIDGSYDSKKQLPQICETSDKETAGSCADTADEYDDNKGGYKVTETQGRCASDKLNDRDITDNDHSFSEYSENGTTLQGSLCMDIFCDNTDNAVSNGKKPSGSSQTPRHRRYMDNHGINTSIEHSVVSSELCSKDEDGFKELNKEDNKADDKGDTVSTGTYDSIIDIETNSDRKDKHPSHSDSDIKQDDSSRVGDNSGILYRQCCEYDDQGSVISEITPSAKNETFNQSGLLDFGNSTEELHYSTVHKDTYTDEFDPDNHDDNCKENLEHGTRNRMGKEHNYTGDQSEITGSQMNPTNVQTNSGEFISECSKSCTPCDEKIGQIHYHENPERLVNSDLSPSAIFPNVSTVQGDNDLDIEEEVNSLKNVCDCDTEICTVQCDIVLYTEEQIKGTDTVQNESELDKEDQSSVQNDGDLETVNQSKPPSTVTSDNELDSHEQINQTLTVKSDNNLDTEEGIATQSDSDLEIVETINNEQINQTLRFKSDNNLDTEEGIATQIDSDLEIAETINNEQINQTLTVKSDNGLDTEEGVATQSDSDLEIAEKCKQTHTVCFDSEINKHGQSNVQSDSDSCLLKQNKQMCVIESDRDSNSEESDGDSDIEEQNNIQSDSNSETEKHRNIQSDSDSETQIKRTHTIQNDSDLDTEEVNNFQSNSDLDSQKERNQICIVQSDSGLDTEELNNFQSKSDLDSQKERNQTCIVQSDSGLDTEKVNNFQSNSDLDSQKERNQICIVQIDSDLATEEVNNFLSNSDLDSEKESNQVCIVQNDSDLDTEEERNVKSDIDLDSQEESKQKLKLQCDSTLDTEKQNKPTHTVQNDSDSDTVKCNEQILNIQCDNTDVSADHSETESSVSETEETLDELNTPCTRRTDSTCKSELDKSKNQSNLELESELLKNGESDHSQFPTNQLNMELCGKIDDGQSDEEQCASDLSASSSSSTDDSDTDENVTNKSDADGSDTDQTDTDENDTDENDTNESDDESKIHNKSNNLQNLVPYIHENLSDCDIPTPEFSDSEKELFESSFIRTVDDVITKIDDVTVTLTITCDGEFIVTDDTSGIFTR